MSQDKVDEIREKLMGMGEQGMVASREKLWTERSIEEKMETLRRHVIHLHETHRNLRDKVYAVEGNFRHHDHSNGRVMCDIGRGENQEMGRYYVPMDLRDKE